MKNVSDTYKILIGGAGLLLAAHLLDLGDKPALAPPTPPAAVEAITPAASDYEIPETPKVTIPKKVPATVESGPAGSFEIPCEEDEVPTVLDDSKQELPSGVWYVCVHHEEYGEVMDDGWYLWDEDAEQLVPGAWVVEGENVDAGY